MTIMGNGDRPIIWHVIGHARRLIGARLRNLDQRPIGRRCTKFARGVVCCHGTVVAAMAVFIATT